MHAFLCLWCESGISFRAPLITFYNPTAPLFDSNQKANYLCTDSRTGTHTTPHESNYLPTLFCMSDIYVCMGIFSHSERAEQENGLVINICVRNGCAGKKHKLISIVSTSCWYGRNEYSVNRLEDVTSLMQMSDLIAFFCHLVLIFLAWSFHFLTGLSR